MPCARHQPINQHVGAQRGSWVWKKFCSSIELLPVWQEVEADEPFLHLHIQKEAHLGLLSASPCVRQSAHNCAMLFFLSPGCNVEQRTLQQ